jgi:hypothetical protein
MLKNWKGSVVINDVEYKNIQEAISTFKQSSGTIHIVLKAQQETKQYEDGKRVEQQDLSSTVPTYKIKVRQYMTKKATPAFDFMKKWNNDVPMPMRIMVGEKVKETRGMVYMKLHADILQEKTVTCMCCGRVLTNPVSQYFGIGPECGNHSYVNPFNSDAELKQAVEEYRKQLQNITWEGWIIKSAIEEEEEI